MKITNDELMKIIDDYFQKIKVVAGTISRLHSCDFDLEEMLSEVQDITGYRDRICELVAYKKEMEEGDDKG